MIIGTEVNRCSFDLTGRSQVVWISATGGRYCSVTAVNNGFLRTYGIHRSTRSLPDVRGRIRICKPWPGSRTAWLGCRSRNPGLRTPERKVGIAHPRLRMRTNNVPRSYESRSYVLLQWEYRPHASAGYHTRLPHHNVQPLSGGSPLRLDSGWVSPFDR